MADPLSAEELALIDDLCRDHRRWAPEEPLAPAIERVLNGGHSNRSVLLRGGSGRWVLRIAQSQPIPGASRERERLLHDRAAAAGLAPRILLADPAAGLLITEHLAGPACDGDPRGVADLLRRIHQLPTDGERLTLACLLDRWQTLRSADSPVSRVLAQHPSRIREIRNRLEELDRSSPVVCHNDLLTANRRHSNSRLVAIDWEYAALGHPFFDLAVCRSEMSAADGATLLREYLEHEPTVEQSQLLHAMDCVYAVVAASWYERLYPSSDLSATARESLARSLAADRP